MLREEDAQQRSVDSQTRERRPRRLRMGSYSRCSVFMDETDVRYLWGYWSPVISVCMDEPNLMYGIRGATGIL